MNRNLLLGCGSILVLALVAVGYKYETRGGVSIDRNGDHNGHISGHLDDPCGKPPANVSSTDEQQLKAKITLALQTAKSSAVGGADFEDNLKRQLQTVSTTSDLANDLAMIDYSVCTLCLSLALSPQECKSARDASQRVYRD